MDKGNTCPARECWVLLHWDHFVSIWFDEPSREELEGFTRTTCGRLSKENYKALLGESSRKMYPWRLAHFVGGMKILRP